jgi:hypothetical protein
MASALDEYLKTGGLPEVVLADDLMRPRILKEHVDLVFYRDLVERYNVGNPQLMRLLLRECLGHPASRFNVHKLYQDLRSQAQALSKDTLYTYLGYLDQPAQSKSLMRFQGSTRHSWRCSLRSPP